MKITDLTDTLFAREIERLAGDAQFWAIRLQNAFGPDSRIELARTSNLDGSNQQPFPLAADLKEVWDYAKGDYPAPCHLQDTIQALCELLWCPIGAHSYQVPNSWWKEPLGFMCRLAWARQALEAGENLNAEQLAMLAGMTSQRIRQLCQTGEIKAGSANQKRNSQQEWVIPAKEAKKFIKKREN
ncbi:hypothetical protein [Syntrophomonas palmitatica]|uniref:hypothetical protein n=1 Tax=Syntrophomonas palmitatica TaxID=402877 RepID=UPI0006CFC39E|nr:hypothetical protein [Syntrophomonas palmitatica]